MEDLENEFERLKEMVIAERGHKKRNFSYSNEVRFLVVDLVKKVGSQAMCAKRLGLSQSSVCKWVLQNQKVQIPRRLTVTNDPSKSVSLTEKTVFCPKLEAVLANGVVIRGFSLTAESLHILGGSK